MGVGMTCPACKYTAEDLNAKLPIAFKGMRSDTTLSVGWRCDLAMFRCKNEECGLIFTRKKDVAR